MAPSRDGLRLAGGIARGLRTVGAACLGMGLLAAAAASRAGPPLPGDYWVQPMRKVHARFTGRPGSFAQFGDSITVSRAFWFGLQHQRKNAPPEMDRAYELVSKYMLPECWDWKGPQYGSEGGMTIRWAHQNVDTWLSRLNPEVALIMFGTNDLGMLDLEEYEAKTRQVVQKCLDRGTVVILSTIPPRHGQADKAAQFAEAVRRIARQLKVPLCDYHAEILKRRPDDWDGTLEKFKHLPGDEYNVPTLISRDGVHPSNPRKYAGDYSAEALRCSGYGLRSYLALLKYAEVIREVLAPKKTRPGTK
ncbi:MAG: SGNH/GDSL hydrolase family protein [Thermoguttaceae bacterium]